MARAGFISKLLHCFSIQYSFLEWLSGVCTGLFKILSTSSEMMTLFSFSVAVQNLKKADWKLQEYLKLF